MTNLVNDTCLYSYNCRYFVHIIEYILYSILYIDNGTHVKSLDDWDPCKRLMYNPVVFYFVPMFLTLQNILALHFVINKFHSKIHVHVQ